MLLLDRGVRRTRGRRPRRRPRRAGRRAHAGARARPRSSRQQVVLGRVGVVVPVEAGVHAAELGQAHRHVAVVEHDGRPNFSRSADGMPRRCAIGTVNTITASGRSRSTRCSRCLRQRGVTQRQITSRVTGRRRCPRDPPRRAGDAVALDPRDGVARPGERLALVVGRVRRGAPPRRLDRPPAVRRHDQVDALLVEALPELPPRGSAAVAEIEVDRRGDGEDLRPAQPPSVAKPG